MQAVLQNPAVLPARVGASTAPRAQLATAPAPRVAAAAQQRRRQRSVAANAKVELRDLDGQLHVLEVAEDQNILEVALDEGLDMPYDCKMGVCL